ncbi:hypothetical protein FACS1894164_07600 [Spirochaetia bacterium]|nr:hypothetical protein FACS1894164_07600 [Spirochaetia bacterium]
MLIEHSTVEETQEEFRQKGLPIPTKEEIEKSWEAQLKLRETLPGIDWDGDLEEWRKDRWVR